MKPFPSVIDEEAVDGNDFQFYISQNNISEHWNEQCQWFPNAGFPIPAVVFRSKIVREFCKIIYWKTWKSERTMKIGSSLSWCTLRIRNKLPSRGRGDFFNPQKYLSGHCHTLQIGIYNIYYIILIYIFIWI